MAGPNSTFEQEFVKALGPGEATERAALLGALKETGNLDADGVPTAAKLVGGAAAQVARSVVLPGRKIGFLGDSITNGSSADIANRSYMYQVIEMLGAGAAPLGAGSIISGHPGARSDTIAPFLTSAIIPAGVDHLITMQGTNDSGQLVSVETYATNMTAQFETARKAGIGLTILSVPPRGGNVNPTAKQNELIDTYAAWLRVVAPRYGNFVDVRSLLQDPAVNYNRMRGIYDSGDGVHPNSLGHWTIASGVVKVLASTMKPRYVIDGFSSLNLITSPYFFGSTSAGWFESVGGTGTAPTYSFVADTSGALNKGVWRQMDFAPGASGGSRQYATSASSGFAAGDKMVFTCKVQIEDVNGDWQTVGPGAGGSANVNVQVYNGTAGTTIAGARPTWGMGYPSAPNIYDFGPFWHTFTVPSGVTVLELRFFVSPGANGHLKVRIGEVGLINLTATGLASLIA